MAITRETLHGAPPQPPPDETVVEAVVPLERGPGWDRRHDARRARLARVEAQAAQMEPGRAAATAVAGLFIGVAWLLGRLWRGAWRALAFTVAAWQVGWVDGTGRGPTKAEVAEENRRLRQEVERLGGAPADTAPAGYERRAQVR